MKEQGVLIRSANEVPASCVLRPPHNPFLAKFPAGSLRQYLRTHTPGGVVKRTTFRPKFSPIPFCLVVCLAQHLAVADIGRAAFAPRGDVVGVHLAQLPDPGFVRVVPNGAQRAV